MAAEGMRQPLLLLGSCLDLCRLSLSKNMPDKVVVHTDGGARGNPGPAALGVVLDLPQGKKTYSKFLGQATNNVAEYQAVIFALKKLKALLGSKRSQRSTVTVLMDSELIVSQLQGEYKIKQKEFYPLFIEIWNLRQDFHSVEFYSVPREQNREADGLVNLALDAN